MSYRIRPAEPLDAEIRRIAGEEIAKAIAALSDEKADPQGAIHATRKRFKKLRGLFQLIRAGEEDFFQRENARYRDAARPLSDARDHAALVEALDALAARIGDEAERAALGRVRAALERRRRGALEARPDLGARIEDALSALQEGRGALDGLALPGGARRARKVLSRGFSDTYARARQAAARAARTGSPEDFHELRKQAKYHRMHLRLLRPVWPRVVEPLADEAARLARALGLDHDYAVFRDGLAAGPDGFGERADLETALPLMERRQAELRTDGLSLAGRLFLGKPKPARRAVDRLYRLAHEEANR